MEKNREEIISLLAENCKEALNSNYGKNYFKNLLNYVKKPSYAQIKAAIRYDWLNIIWVKNPSLKLKIYALQRSTSAILLFHNPERILLQAAIKNIFAIRESYLLLRYDLDDDLLEKLIDKNDDICNCIKNPSERIKKKIIQTSSWNIINIHDPSEELQLLALQANLKVIDSIQCPTRKALDYCIDQGAVLPLQTLEKMPDDLIVKYYKSKLFKEIIE